MVELEKGEYNSEKMEKCCYLGDMFSLNGGASEAVSARICSAWEKFKKTGGVLFGKQGLSLKQHNKIYQYCIRLVLSYYSET